MKLVNIFYLILFFYFIIDRSDLAMELEQNIKPNLTQLTAQIKKGEEKLLNLENLTILVRFYFHSTKFFSWHFKFKYSIIYFYCYSIKIR